MPKNKLSLREFAWLAIVLIAAMTAMLWSGVRSERQQADEIANVNAVIDKFQEAYSSKNIDDVRLLFYAEAVIAWDFNSGSVQAVRGLEEWLQGTKDDVFDMNRHISDVLSDREIRIYGNIAYAVVTYNYRDDKEHHLGKDVITFLKIRDRWRILSLQWTGAEVK